MSYGLKLKQDGGLDFVSIGALVHRLDPGVIPFRKANEFKVHVSGGEYNVAANLSDCFRLKTGVVTAMARAVLVVPSPAPLPASPGTSASPTSLPTASPSPTTQQPTQPPEPAETFPAPT
ncbi:hypothetical protein MJD09_00020, partial [bacterium]|nr:hypothetical protein [bacterium]